MNGIREIQEANIRATDEGQCCRQKRDLRHVVSEVITLIENGGEDDDALVKLRRILEETA